MEAVIFTGIQGAGKSTFYRERFFNTHLRINLDMLRTRNRERIMIGACIAAGQRFVVDNTNLLAEDRARYIAAAREANFRVVGYYFKADLTGALERNRLRAGRELIPDKAIIGSYKRMQLPAPAEGFDELWYVELDPELGFIVKEWAVEIR